MILKYPVKYEENKFIGSGSYGTVTRGYDVNNNVNIAIKKIFVGNSDKGDMKQIKSEV